MYWGVRSTRYYVLGGAYVSLGQRLQRSTARSVLACEGFGAIRRKKFDATISYARFTIARSSGAPKSISAVTPCVLILPESLRRPSLERPSSPQQPLLVGESRPSEVLCGSGGDIGERSYTRGSDRVTQRRRPSPQPSPLNRGFIAA